MDSERSRQAAPLSAPEFKNGPPGGLMPPTPGGQAPPPPGAQVPAPLSGKVPPALSGKVPPALGGKVPAALGGKVRRLSASTGAKVSPAGEPEKKDDDKVRIPKWAMIVAGALAALLLLGLGAGVAVRTVRNEEPSAARALHPSIKVHTATTAPKSQTANTTSPPPAPATPKPTASSTPAATGPVTPQTIQVSVSGSQTFGSSSAAFAGAPVSALPSGLNLSGTGTCTRVSGATINASLPVGSYTVDTTSCGGLSLSGANAANYTLGLIGGVFSVEPEQFAVTVSGNQTFGSSTPTFAATPVSPLPPGVSLSGTVGCTSIGAPIDASLQAGSYTVAASSCTGLSLTGANAANYALRIVGGPFAVNPAVLAATVSGNENTTPVFTVTPVSTLPLNVQLQVPASFTCTRVITTIDTQGYPVLALTVDASSCTVLSLTGSNAADYTLSLVNGPFTAPHAYYAIG